MLGLPLTPSAGHAAPGEARRPPPTFHDWVSKIGPKPIQKLIKIGVSFWSRFGCLLGPFWPPFWALLAAQIGPSSAQEAPVELLPP